MTPRRNRRAGVEDLWRRRDGTPSRLDGQGMRWRARYVDEQSRETTRRFRRKIDAQQWLDEQTTAIVSGVYVDPKRSATSFGVVAEQWFTTKSTTAPKTQAGYRSLLDTQVLPRWGRERLSDIHHEDVQTWVTGLSATGGYRWEEKGLSASRVIQCYQVVDQVLRYAIRTKKLAINPADETVLPRKAEGEKRYLSHEQVDLVAYESGRFRALVFTLAYSGIRFGEAVALRAKNVDLDKRRLRIVASATPVPKQGIVEGLPKGRDSRSVPLPAFVVDELREIVEDKAPDELVFPSRRGSYLTESEMRWVFDAAAEDAGIEGLTPHELRHTAASLAIRAGANVKVVQRMLGHKSATLTLDRYGHLFPDDLDTVADALDTAYRLRTERVNGAG